MVSDDGLSLFQSFFLLKGREILDFGLRYGDPKGWGVDPVMLNKTS